MIEKALLDILACPLTHAALVQVGEDWLYSTDRATRRKYPIRDGIPILLIEEGIAIDVAEYESAMANAAARTG
ncbi:MAG: hypothetical protein HY763_14535 [Planctomycetes bacterium]|nr:hypothetical protein [Planctomycetota bacterium]